MTQMLWLIQNGIEEDGFKAIANILDQETDMTL